MRPGAHATSVPHDEAWDRQIGAIWARILRLHGLDPAGQVAEVGPGFTLKVGLGLKEYGFRGSLYVVEPDDKIREWVLPRYRDLLPSARVIGICSRLGTAGSALPARVDALLMNHLLDDLVLDAVTSERRRQLMFRNMYSGAPCRTDVRSAWLKLAAEPGKLATASRTVVDDICDLYRRTRPKVLGISHYPSWFQTQNGLRMVDEMTVPVLRQLARRLPREAPGGQARLMRYGQKEPRWLVMHSQEARHGE